MTQERKADRREDEHTQIPLNLIERVCKDPVLTNPMRLAIMLTLVLRGATTFADLQRVLNLSPSTLESHLKKLEEHGFIKKQKGIINAETRVVIVPTEEGIKKTLEYVRALQELSQVLGIRL